MFYKILPAHNSYKAGTPLIYSSNEKLSRGQLVTVSLRHATVAGIVTGSASKPAFAAKPITSASSLPPMPSEQIALAEWMMAYYASGAGPVARQLVSVNSLRQTSRQANTIKNTARERVDPPVMTPEQKLVVDKITTAGTYLLHGETGSGKTRVYLEMSVKTLAIKKSVVILTPEIGLTSQLEKQFKDTLNEQIIVAHSSLTQSERRAIWQRVLVASQPLVVIGPRSVLFLPLKDIGLIVIDEAHDSSYKQSDAPHYQTGTVAAKLAQLHNCPLVLGSATPSISDYFLAQQKGRPILTMHQLALSHGTRPVKPALVDIKDRSKFKHSRHLSDALIQATQSAISSGRQALFFLNRRGTARVVVCSNCGWTATCPHCGFPLTYHGDQYRLRCHGCGFSQPALASCPSCGDTNLDYKSIGAKAIEAEAKKLFPKATIRRFDSDSPKLERLEALYEEVKSGGIDIIIGTQTVAKGLDLPKLAVVGVIVADTGLYLPDFSAGERTYQLIRQVIGRVGRGHTSGQAIIQTYNPENPVIRAAISGDYAGFYQRELAERQKYSFPPACHLLKIEVGRASAASAELAASKLKQTLAASSLQISIDGPSPSFHEIRAGKHYQQLVVKSKSRSALLAALAKVPQGERTELDPVSLL